LTAEERIELVDLEAQLARGPDEVASRRLRQLWWLTDFADRRLAAENYPPTDYPRNQSLITDIEIDWQRMLDADLPKRTHCDGWSVVVVHSGVRRKLRQRPPRLSMSS
jgi:hypothetical protein